MSTPMHFHFKAAMKNKTQHGFEQILCGFKEFVGGIKVGLYEF